MSGKWKLAEDFILRSTGFAFSDIEGLRFSRTAQAIYDLLDQEEQLKPVLCSFREKSGDWLSNREVRLRWKKMKRSIGKGEAITEEELEWIRCHGGPVETAAAWNRKLAEIEEARRVATGIFEEELQEKRRELRRLVSNPRFQEAVFLSSPQMYKKGLLHYLNTSGEERNAEIKRLERQLIAYVQRMVGKNETTSFFGPINYGSFTEKKSPSDLDFTLDQPDIGYNWTSDLQHRETFMAYWATQVLAETFSRLPGVFSRLKPLRSFLHRLLDNHLIQAAMTQKRTPLTPIDHQLLRLADGTRTVEQLVRELEMSEERLKERLVALEGQKWLTLTWTVPVTATRTLDWLVHEIQQVKGEDPEVERWRHSVQRLLDLKNKYSYAGVVEKERMLREANDIFRDLTGEETMRRGGQIYADRTLFYEECRGQIDHLQLSTGTRRLWEERLRPVLQISAKNALEVLSLPRVQEAIAHSNPQVWRSLQRFLATDAQKMKSSRKRYDRRTLIRYLQRFLFKNDTTSFFGPLNYGSFRDLDRPLTVIRKGSIPSRRRSFLTYWVVEALAKQVSRPMEWRDTMPIALHDAFYLGKSGIVHAQTQKSIPLPVEVIQVLQRAEDHIPARELLQGCSEMTKKALEKLHEKGVILWEFRVPQAHHEVLERLLDFVKGLPAGEIQEQWYRDLQQFADWQTTYSAADAKGKVEILGQASTLFEQVTGQDSTQLHGETYADRLLFCEETQGDVQEFTFSLEMKEDLESRISPLLEWGATVAMKKRENAQHQAKLIFAAMKEEWRCEKIPFLAVLSELTRRMSAEGFHPDSSSLIRQLAANGELEQKVIELPESWLKGQISDHGLDQHLCVCSPDIMLQAESVEHVHQGEYQWVIGEVHYGTQGMSNLLYFHGQREEHIAEVREALRSLPNGEFLANVVLKQRAGKSFFVEMFEQTLTLLGRSEKKRDAVRRFSELWVVEQKGELVLVDAEGRRFIPYMGDPDSPVAFVFAEPSIEIPKIETEGHLPRLTYRGLVLQRERWNLPTADWLSKSDQPHERYLHAWRQKEQLGMPDEVFVRVSHELKPFYVNFRSYDLVDLLLRHLQDEKRVTFSELLPDRSSAWFSNEKGTYCCELRTNVARFNH